MSEINNLLKKLDEMTSGSVAPVSAPLTTQLNKRVTETPQVEPEILEYGNWENSSLTTSNKLKKQRKKPSKLAKSIYGENKKNNKSITESSFHDEFSDFITQLKKSGKLKPVHKGTYTPSPEPKIDKDELIAKLHDLESRFDPNYEQSDDYSFWQKQKDIESQIRTIKDNLKHYVKEESLEETDLILNPNSLSKKVNGLVNPDKNRTDHEIEMSKGDLFQTSKNALTIFNLIKDIPEQQGIEGWVQEKIIKANDYLNTVREYLESKQLESMDGLSPNTKMFAESEQPKVRKYTKKRPDGSTMERWEVLDSKGSRVKEFDDKKLAQDYLKKNKFDLMY